MAYNRKKVMPQVCDHVASGKSLRDIEKLKGMPSMRTIIQWAADDDDFALQYARAMETRHERMAEELLEIADKASNDWMLANDPENEGYRLTGEHVQRSRLRIDTRKWLLSKLASKKYGDRLEHSGTVDFRALLTDALGNDDSEAS